MSINKMVKPLDDISSDDESILSSNSFFDDFFEKNSFKSDQEENFFEKNASFNENFKNFDIDVTFEDRVSVGSFSREASRSSSETENSEIFLTKSLAVKEIIHSLTPIEYPPTSEEGIAIVYHIDGWENVDSTFVDVQYSMGKPSGQNRTTCYYLGDVTVTKKDRTCQKIKLCEFASSELQEMQHKSCIFSCA
ncbi:hypothetical protein C2G38_2320518 [Gigaspora rosea]|uniref:Uncharacterized protein n=1 Tax=Gigaspora rosea TaxID=44941 RepID=A0A397V0H8_9GLOM|nr:hypothetical protein C2G38_2320518 [Gigaspora rosea]